MNKIKPLNSLKISKDIVTLIKKNHKIRPIIENLVPDSKANLKMVNDFVNGAIQRGICEYFYQDKKLKAVFLVLHAHLAPGLPLNWGLVETDQTKDSEIWLLKKMQQHSSFFNVDSMLELPIYLKKCIPKIYRLGYFIDTVRTVGRVEIAYKRLMNLRSPEGFVNGYTIERVKNKFDLKQIQKIEYNEFKRNPQFGWFVSSAEWLNQSYKTRLADLKNPTSNMYVIKKRKKVLGFFGYNLQTTQFKGKFAGTEFVLDKSIQGKGFSYIGYRLMLEHMLQNKVDFLIGNTSQPGVLRAAQVMGRVPLNYSLRFGKGYFKSQHFKY